MNAAWFLRAWFVVPASQVRVLDLGYQLYCFEVFHRSKWNRLSHAIGIPLSLMATYVLASAIPHGAVIALAFVTGVHVALCVRSSLARWIPAVLLTHGALFLFAMHVLARFLRFDGPLVLHPTFHVLVWPVVQYATHLLEPEVPPPLSGTQSWRSTREMFARASVSHLAFSFALAPLHMFVELLSSYRNLFVLFVVFAWKLGIRPKSLVGMREFIDRECAKNDPLLEYSAYLEAAR